MRAGLSGLTGSTPRPKLWTQGAPVARQSPSRLLWRSAAMTTLADIKACYTIGLTTMRKDGTPVTTPVTVVFDGDTGYVRTTGGTGKVKRIRRDGDVRAAPATARGTVTGEAVPMVAHLADAAETAAARRFLRRKYPFVHGVVFRIGERFQRTPTVYIVLEPIPDAA